MSLAQALLVAGSALPLVGQLCEACQGILGSAGEFSEKADDVLVAAERVVDVLRTVHLMAKNVDRLEDGRDLAESTMRRLIELMSDFHAAVRQFGQRGWFSRMWLMRSHVHTLARLDKRIVEQLRVFHSTYRLAADAYLAERTYRLERSMEALIARHCATTGETAEAAARSLAEDPVAITSVAIEAHVPVEELTSELREFRLEVKEGLAKVDTQLKELLRNRGNEQQLATILAAVRASVRRDEELLAAAQRTTAQLENVSGAVASSARRDEKLLAAVQAGTRRNEKFIVAAAQSGERRIDAVEARVRRDGAKLDGIKEEMSAIGASMAKSRGRSRLALSNERTWRTTS